MSKNYEGNVGNYSFIMNEETVIEVWGDDLDRPETFIFVEKGSIKTEKDFHSEISYWFLDNMK
jgi:hypothetical protein